MGFFGGKFLVQGFFLFWRGGGWLLPIFDLPRHLKSVPPPPPGLGLLLRSLSWACLLFIYLFFVCLFVCLFAWQCHPVVANRLHSRFQSWLSDWVKSNVTGDQEGRCRDWLLGKVDGLHPCTTTCEVVTSAAIEHNKYSVKWDKDKKDKQEVAQNDSKESEQKAAS